MAVLHTHCIKQNCISNHSIISLIIVENHLYTKFSIKNIENKTIIGDLKKSVFVYAC